MIPVEALDALAAVVGAGRVQTDGDVLEPFAFDWLQRRGTAPVAVVAPGTTEELADVLSVCHHHRIAVTTRGGGSSLVAGATPHVSSAVMLTTRRLQRVDLDDVAAGAVTVGAGVTLAGLDTALDGSGWRYPVDFGARDLATIGGTVATNAGGNGAFRHGVTRHRVLGLDVVTATGAVLSHRGAPLKDNAGYSLDSLICGSEGTLGVVAAATLRLAPRPADLAVAVVGCVSAAGAVDLARQLRRHGDGLEAVEYLSGSCIAATTAAYGHDLGIESPHAVLVEVGDATNATDRLADLIGLVCPTAPSALSSSEGSREAMWLHRDRIGELLVSRGPVMKFDLSLPGDGFATLIDEAPTLARSGTPYCFGHACDQNLHLNISGVRDADRSAVEAAVYARVLELGGSIAAEHGIGHAKRSWLSDARSAAEIDAMRAIKSALDPHWILNPGVLLEPPG